jgi:hypothetical protein
MLPPSSPGFAHCKVQGFGFSIVAHVHFDELVRPELYHELRDVLSGLLRGDQVLAGEKIDILGLLGSGT